MSKKLKAVIILTLCGLFLFLKYIAQLYPSLISATLINKFQLTGVELGIIASSYYYSYLIMQLVSGVLIDKYNLKVIATVAAFTVSLGLIGFALTDDFVSMCFYRALMGFGCAFATSMYMKCAALWTEEKFFPIVSSFLATATMLGAAVGSQPIAILFAYTGWRSGLIWIAAVGFILSIFIFLFVTSQNSLATIQKKVSYPDLKKIFKRPANYWLLIYSGVTFSPIVILGGLWGVPFLQVKFNAESLVVAKLISTMFIGHAVGSPVWSMLSKYIESKKILMATANAGAFISLSLIIYGVVSYSQANVLFFMFGFCVGSFMLCFSICREINHVAVFGFAVAFINTGEGVFGSILEPGVGLILDLLKNPANSNFSLENYQSALILLPLCYVFSTFVVCKLPGNKKEHYKYPTPSLA